LVGISLATDLPRERLPETLRRIAAWRADPGASLNCPICEAPGFEIIDRSARPYSEWYALNCRVCDLNATLHIPMPGPSAI
jgi:hypothetical protein